MTSNGETINEMITILEFQDENGHNCLMACYNMLYEYVGKGNDLNQTPMKKPTEETIEFLIEMGRDNRVDMARVINNVPKDGATLFNASTDLSEKVFLLLISMQVKVSEITYLFAVVDFKVN